MKVTIIIPCYNHATYIGECLDSVVAQTYTNWDCVIVDDGSQDDSVKIIEELIKNDKRFQLIAQENLGVSAARNRAIASSTGTFILPLDADDFLESSYIEDCIKAYNKRPDLQLVYGLVKRFGEEQGISNVESFSMERLLYGNFIHCSAMFRKDAWKAAGGYDESMHTGLEDWEFWINILKENPKVHCIEKLGLHYRIKNDSRNNSFSNSEFAKIKKYISKKHIAEYLKIIGDLPTFLKEYRKMEINIAFLKTSAKHALKVLVNKMQLWKM